MKNIKMMLTVCVLTVMMLFGLSCQADVVNAAGEADYHLGIAPTQSNLGTIIPGKSYDGEFSVHNHGNKIAEYEIDFAPYGVQDENYSPVYDRETSYTEIVKWIETSSNGGVIEPGATDTVKYTVNVPEDAHGGAQSAIIIVRLKQDNNVTGSAVQAVQQLGYLVFANVDGDIIETGKILENKVPSFLFNPPIYASTMVENTGNVYTRAKYSLQVFPLFSDEEVYTNEEEPEKSIIFPETKRFNQIQWEGAPQLGIFKVRSTVKIFDEESVTEKIVFLCPIWFLFIVLLLIFCIIFWLVSRIFKRRKEA